MYVRLKAFWNVALGLLRADDAGVVGFELKNVFRLTGELWKSRIPGDDLEICLRPGETASGLRRMKAMAADDRIVDGGMK